MAEIVAAARRIAAAAAAAAVTVARGKGSRFGGGRQVVEQRTNSHANSILAFLCPFVVFSFIKTVCTAYWC